MTSRMLVTLVVLALYTATARSHGAPDATALIGSWKLVSYEDRDSSGASVYPYSKAPAGLLIYDATGHMAIQIMTTPPPDVASDDWNLFTVKEKVALYDAYTAYFGRYDGRSRSLASVHWQTRGASLSTCGRSFDPHGDVGTERQDVERNPSVPAHKTALKRN